MMTDADDLELTILMPCLNEAETLASCLVKARVFLDRAEINGEIIVADNGSTDGSQEIARAHGARVVPVAARGYGAALRGGIEASRSRYVIMGDADDSYDFSNLSTFVAKLRDGVQLVLGNRFQGGIDKGAMPFLHKYLGNPVLSWLGRLFFRVKIGDFHCGLRGFRRDSIRELNLRTTGMEFASEMIVRSALAGYRIDETPTTLRKDGRSRPPHLRTWRDGWRHLSFLLMYSPKWLFLYPGFALLGFGIAGAVFLLPGPVMVGGVGFDIHTFFVACIVTLLGTQSISFAVIARQFAAAQGLIPASRRLRSALDRLSLEALLGLGAVLMLIGGGGAAWCVAKWASLGFGSLTYVQILRILILSMTTLAIGFQLCLVAFLSAIVRISTKGEGRLDERYD